MERGDFFRWAILARRLVPSRLITLIFRKRCCDVAYKTPEDDNKVVRIGQHCPAGICEYVDVGRFGSPGRVRTSEALHSVIIAPTDLDKTALAITMITHAEKKGMSVLREAASSAEFKTTIQQRIKKPNQTFHGVASFACSAVRDLVADQSTGQRKVNDRLYYVLDTDMDGLPHHAEIFATVPRPYKNLTNKAAWRLEREKLLDLLSAGLTSPTDFRDGTAIP